MKHQESRNPKTQREKHQETHPKIQRETSNLVTVTCLHRLGSIVTASWSLHCHCLGLISLVCFFCIRGLGFLFFMGFFQDFLENNYKTQTISLVRKRFKLIWHLAIRVQRTRFLGLLFIILPAAEVVHVGEKSSSLDSVSKPRNRVHWTQFLYI